jgi:TPR repeat protein
MSMMASQRLRSGSVCEHVVEPVEDGPEREAPGEPREPAGDEDEDVLADPPRGRQYSEKACSFGSKLSCGADEVRTKIDAARSDLARGRSMFQERCDKGNAMACGMLGELLLNGTAEDRAKATALLRKGCDGGYDPACKKLGGRGVP